MRSVRMVTVVLVLTALLASVPRVTADVSPTDEPPPYRKMGPHRSELRADRMPLVPGEVSELRFELWATSVLIRTGHRLRIALAGADRDTFQRYPRSGEVPTLIVERNRVADAVRVWRAVDDRTHLDPELLRAGDVEAQRLARLAEVPRRAG